MLVYWVFGIFICFTVCSVISALIFEDENYGESLVVTIITIIFACSSFPEIEVEYSNRIERKEFISANTSEGVSGSFRSGFFISSGYINNIVQYRLREQLAPNRYKDFLISDAILEEDPTLTNSGVVLTEYKCTTKEVESYLWFTEEKNIPLYGEGNRCSVESNLIRVPQGTVVKNISL